MDATHALQLPIAFWESVRGARKRLLLLDYDGTLAPFRVAREEAWPLPRVVRILGSIAAEPGSEVAVLSGRPVRELTRFLGGLPARLVGEHGWEERGPDGGTLMHPLAPECEALLQDAARAAEAAGGGRFLERKRAALVLHTRGLPTPQALELERACRLLWDERFRGSRLRITPMNGGLEIRAAGRDKGTAVREIIERSGPGTYAVYVGDDTTDEDAFREVRGVGFGIRVGPGDRSTLALGRMEDRGAIEEFLKRWRDAIGAKHSGEVSHEE